MLEAAVQKIAPLDPNYQLDVVVIPEDKDNLEKLKQLIEAHGGRTLSMNSESAHSRIPVGRVLHLAESDLVSAIRLARMHQMHKP